LEEKRELGNTCSGMLVPNAQELLDTRKMKARFLYTVISVMDTQFEIHYLGKKYAVDLTHWTCSCRKWQLSGIPCVHVIATINHIYLDPTVYCLKYFTVEYFTTGQCCHKGLHAFPVGQKSNKGYPRWNIRSPGL
ncbi:hypothetical protein AMTR_s00088p00180620, partial [Amborella trichopoda]